MKRQLFYLIAVGPVIKSNGGQLQHGQVSCTFDCALSDEQQKEINDALGCANLTLCNKETYERDYKSP